MNVENVGRVMVSLLVVVAFLAYIVLISTYPISPDMKDVVNTAGGALGAAFVSIVNYWVGSSAGSSSKDKQIASLTGSKAS